MSSFTPNLKVFISYSRDDMVFADELVAGLEYDGRYEVTIDRHSIAEGENWKVRLGGLIADADAIVFVLSPASAQSEICAWEVEQAHRLSKRMLPVLVEPVGAVPVPERLAALNYVRFDPHQDGRTRSFMAGLNALVRALNTDIKWLREHTRYLMLARRWDEAGRRGNRLLSGTDIAAAKRWIAGRPKDMPEPTELHLDFIRASEEAEAARASAERKRLAEIEAAQSARAEALVRAEQATAEKAEASRRLVRRTFVGMALVSLLAAVTGALFIYATGQRQLAEEKAEEAKRQTKIAQQQESLAKKETARADEFINLVSSHAAGRTAMEKICLEGIDVTTTLATTIDEELQKQAQARFWQLYYGPMYIVEIHQAKHSNTNQSKIEAAMVKFGRRLERHSGKSLPHKDLCEDAKAVSDECAAYLDVAAHEPCT